jgi:hypothetical protein
MPKPTKFGYRHIGEQFFHIFIHKFQNVFLRRRLSVKFSLKRYNQMTKILIRLREENRKSKYRIFFRGVPIRRWSESSIHKKTIIFSSGEGLIEDTEMFSILCRLEKGLNKALAYKFCIFDEFKNC